MLTTATFCPNTSKWGRPAYYTGWGPDLEDINCRPRYVFEDGSEYCPPAQCQGTHYMAYWPVEPEDWD